MLEGCVCNVYIDDEVYLQHRLGRRLEFIADRTRFELGQ
jgi:hypothetical protein